MRRLVVISGAGISVESGVRAFRTDTESGKSLWDEYDLEEVCSISAFNAGLRYKRGGVAVGATDVDGLDLYTKTHDFYNLRREELKTVEPNLAHMRVGEWSQRYPDQVVNITTNVDDLLERGGVKGEIVHVHGFLKNLLYKIDAHNEERCVDIGYTSINVDDYYWAKPDVVFFGEMAPKYKEMYNILDNLTSNDLVIVVGCSNVVINFNWELFPSVKNNGTKVVVVNPKINYLEQEGYDSFGVTVYRAGAVETFSNKHFIKMVEDHLEGN